MGLVPVPLLLGKEGKLFSFNKSWFGIAGFSRACSTEIGIFTLLQASAQEILLVTLIISAFFLYRGQVLSAAEWFPLQFTHFFTVDYMNCVDDRLRTASTDLCFCISMQRDRIDCIYSNARAWVCKGTFQMSHIRLS